MWLYILPTYLILGIVFLALVGLAIGVLVRPTIPPQGFDRSDARYWKLGFYSNPADPGLFVPKRNPALGGAINIGHPRGRLIAVGMLLGIALFILLVAGLALALLPR